MAHFIVKFLESISKFDVKFREGASEFNMDFGELSVLPNAEVYSGSYEITPAVELQTVGTAQKFMKYDMTINAIPYFDVSNTAGGSTVYIGNELEY